MGILDPGLNFLLQSKTEPSPFFNTTKDLVEFNAVPVEREVRVIVHFKDSLVHAEQAGFKPTAAAGGVASGFASKADLERIADAENVILVESSRPMISELDRSLKEIRADSLHSADPACKGAGVIIGIIDSGIDFTHKCFCDAAGRTRILALWNQNLTPRANERHPAGFTYGVEYTKETIDAAIALGEHAFDLVRLKEKKGLGHGTHVAGIAAGNGNVAGAAKSGQGGNVAEELPAGTYVGVAPEADIMFVAFDSKGAMGESSYMFDAIKYLFDKAGDRPIVVNISQGDYVGPHDGTSGLERFIDGIVGKPGRVIVKSAGNGGGNKTHAGGTIHGGERIVLNLKVPENDKQQDVIDIWYPGADRIEVAVKTPLHSASNGLSPGASKVLLTLPNKNRVYIESIVQYPLNGDNRIYVRLLPGELNVIEEGDWEIILTGLEVGDGRFHAWIDKSKDADEPVPVFYGPFANDSCTISIPGTASEIITVGSYITHIHVADLTDENRAAIEKLNETLATYSSLGPTRDGRMKPEIVAPGEAIISACRQNDGKVPYIMMGGTSMSAPHVAGAIALLLEKNPKLTQTQVRQLICAHARTDKHTASPPEGWGTGKLDVLSCHKSLTLFEE